MEGISVDWIGNNLYWTNDGYRKTISIARLDRASQTRKTLLEGNMSHPRAIVVDPPNRSVTGKITLTIKAKNVFSCHSCLIIWFRFFFFCIFVDAQAHFCLTVAKILCQVTFTLVKNMIGVVALIQIVYFIYITMCFKDLSVLLLQIYILLI